jgi:hypothetical protein
MGMKNFKCRNGKLKMAAVFMFRSNLLGITYDAMNMIRFMMMKDQMQKISGNKDFAKA